MLREKAWYRFPEDADAPGEGMASLPGASGRGGKRFGPVAAEGRALLALLAELE